MKRHISNRARRVVERLEDRFERHVVNKRADSMSLSVPGLIRPAAVYALEMAFGGDRMTRHVQRHFKRIGRPDIHISDPQAGAELFMEALGIKLEIVEGSHENFPKEGPVLVVGNHPHGILEVMAGATQVLRVRDDVKVMVNLSVAHNPLFGHFCIPMDLRGTPKAERANLRAAAQFRAHMKKGGVGVIAPAGAIADRKKLKQRATDWEWRTTAAKWARQTGATVVPIYCDSENEMLFHVASKLSMSLRMGLIYFQNWRLRNRVLKIAIGDPITPEVMQAFPTSVEATEFIRAETYRLERRYHGDSGNIDDVRTTRPKALKKQPRPSGKRHAQRDDQGLRAGSNGGLRY